VPQKNTVFNLTSAFACYYEQLMQENVDISDEIPFKLPDSWSWCRFSTLVNFVMGKTPARSQKEFWDMPFLPWVSIADMIPGGVIKKTKEFISSNALSHCFSGRISPAGTLIMSFKLTIGRVSILNMPAQHNEAIISVFPFADQENINRDYLLKILPVMVDFVKKSPAIKGNTLNSDSLSKMLIPLPPLAEQKKIVSRITQYETILKSIQE
jgi:type I restriction enzyme S subunit